MSHSHPTSPVPAHVPAPAPTPSPATSPSLGDHLCGSGHRQEHPGEVRPPAGQPEDDGGRRGGGQMGPAGSTGRGRGGRQVG